MEYLFEEIQHLRFAVYDVDDKQNMDDVDKQQLLGTMECTMGDIVAAGIHLTKSLKLKGSINLFACICFFFSSRYLGHYI